MMEWAKPGDKEALVELFHLCFPGEEDFCRWYFGRLWQLLPRRIGWQEQSWPAAYVFAVGTHPNWRGQGLAGALLRQAEQEAADQGAQTLFLVPQRPSLFQYYARFGYRTAFSLAVEQVEAKAGPADLRLAGPDDLPAMQKIYQDEMGGRPYVEPCTRARCGCWSARACRWPMVLRKKRKAGGVWQRPWGLVKGNWPPPCLLKRARIPVCCARQAAPCPLPWRCP